MIDDAWNPEGDQLIVVPNNARDDFDCETYERTTALRMVCRGNSQWIEQAWVAHSTGDVIWQPIPQLRVSADYTPG